MLNPNHPQWARICFDSVFLIPVDFFLPFFDSTCICLSFTRSWIPQRWNCDSQMPRGLPQGLRVSFRDVAGGFGVAADLYHVPVPKLFGSDEPYHLIAFKESQKFKKDSFVFLLDRVARDFGLALNINGCIIIMISRKPSTPFATWELFGPSPGPWYGLFFGAGMGQNLEPDQSTM